MSFFEGISSAFSNVLSNKMRTFLTMLGIIIGISSVIMITSVGGGIKQGLNKEFGKIGSNLMAIYLKSWNDDVQIGDFLTREDIELLKSHENMDFVAPVCSSNATVNHKNPNLYGIYCTVSGTTGDYVKVGRLELASGRFINDGDNKARSNAAVINEWLAKSIFGYSDVVGKSFTADFNGAERELYVVGVLKSAEENSIVSAYDKGEIFMPFETVMELYDNDYVDQIDAGIKDMSRLDETVKEVDRLLGLAHNNGDRNMYGIETYAEQVGVINNVINGFTLFMGFVAAISLLVGGIGVMNIMLVTVTERTREIGIRKSIGATAGDIRLQFVTEAVILSLMGGIIGVILGYCEGIAASSVISGLAGLDFAARLSLPAVGAAVAVTVAIGIVFGVYPAGKAARLDPIEALRYE